MENYAQNWFKLVFSSNPGLERYWITVAVFAAICLLIGMASLRLRLAAAVVTTVVFAAYVAALVPLMVWASSCPSCGAGEHESTRSILLFSQHVYLGGFFAMGIAALWIGVLLSQSVKAIMARRPSPRPSVTPLPRGEGPGERA